MTKKCLILHIERASDSVCFLLPSFTVVCCTLNPLPQYVMPSIWGKLFSCSYYNMNIGHRDQTDWRVYFFGLNVTSSAVKRKAGEFQNFEWNSVSKINEGKICSYVCTYNRRTLTCTCTWRTFSKFWTVCQVRFRTVCHGWRRRKMNRLIRRPSSCRTESISKLISLLWPCYSKLLTRTRSREYRGKAFSCIPALH